MRVYLRTFGCRANHYDSEAVRAMIERAGHHLTSEVGDADVAVFNSCAVTAEAEADVRSAVRRAARAQPGLRSVIMGCATGLATRRGDASLRSLPTVERLVDGADMTALAAALDSPVRREMRADFAGFPRYRGRVTHYAMTTQVLRP